MPKSIDITQKTPVPKMRRVPHLDDGIQVDVLNLQGDASIGHNIVNNNWDCCNCSREAGTSLEGWTGTEKEKRKVYCHNRKEATNGTSLECEQNDSNHIKASDKQVDDEKLTELESRIDRLNEQYEDYEHLFDEFGKMIATQLKSLPINSAILLQIQLQDAVSKFLLSLTKTLVKDYTSSLNKNSETLKVIKLSQKDCAAGLDPTSNFIEVAIPPSTQIVSEPNKIVNLPMLEINQGHITINPYSAKNSNIVDIKLSQKHARDGQDSDDSEYSKMNLNEAIFNIDANNSELVETESRQKHSACGQDSDDTEDSKINLNQYIFNSDANHSELLETVSRQKHSGYGQDSDDTEDSEINLKQAIINIDANNLELEETKFDSNQATYGIKCGNSDIVDIKMEIDVETGLDPTSNFIEVAIPPSTQIVSEPNKIVNLPMLEINQGHITINPYSAKNSNIVDIKLSQKHARDGQDSDDSEYSKMNLNKAIFNIDANNSELVETESRQKHSACGQDSDDTEDSEINLNPYIFNSDANHSELLETVSRQKHSACGQDSDDTEDSEINLKQAIINIGANNLELEETKFDPNQATYGIKCGNSDIVDIKMEIDVETESYD